MSTVTGRPSQRLAVLDAARELLREDRPVSLDSVARHVGMSKPGLMYHFPTKQALMLGLVDRLIDGYEATLVGLCPAGTAGPVGDRYAAWVTWCITFTHDPADLVVHSDPKLRKQLNARWTERLGGWLEIPDTVSLQGRARLHSARLLADGWWIADATNLFIVPHDDRKTVLSCALDLLSGVDRE